MIRESFVGTFVGSGLADFRNFKDFLSLSRHNPEKASLVANALISDRLIASLPVPGSAFLDVGAHIGAVFTSAKRQDPTLHVYAVEADAAKARTLSARFSYATVFNCAVGETEGTANFYIDRDRSGYSSLEKRDHKSANITTVEVEVRRLDAIFADERFDVVKIDVEGAELGVLRGGASLFERSRPTVMFESTGVETNDLGYSAVALWEWLDSRGFDVCVPERLAHDGPPMSLETFVDAHHYPMRSLNFFAVARERRAEIRDRARRILRIA